jgi:hypothetical protein
MRLYVMMPVRGGNVCTIHRSGNLWMKDPQKKKSAVCTQLRKYILTLITMSRKLAEGLVGNRFNRDPLNLGKINI